MTFEWPSWVDPLPFPFPELNNIWYRSMWGGRVVRAGRVLRSSEYLAAGNYVTAFWHVDPSTAHFHLPHPGDKWCCHRNCNCAKLVWTVNVFWFLNVYFKKWFLQRFHDFCMERFLQQLSARRELLDGDIFELLYSLSGNRYPSQQQL